jgi:hypothetical protein
VCFFIALLTGADETSVPPNRIAVWWSGPHLMAAIMTVFELPPRLSLSSQVRGESLKGTCTCKIPSRHGAYDTCLVHCRCTLESGAAFWVRRNKAKMQFDRALRALLMWHLTSVGF